MNYKIPVLLSAVSILFVIGCERKSFVEHKMKMEKTGKNCSKLETSFRMNSNFGGERYEFEKCLPADFDDASVISERSGDTVIVHFGNVAGSQPTGVYKVTLDIDSYPLYHFLTIDGDTYTIIPTEK